MPIRGSGPIAKTLSGSRDECQKPEVVPILVLFRPTGSVARQNCRIDEFANTYGFRMFPTILDRDVCVKLMLGGEWIATAHYV